MAKSYFIISIAPMGKGIVLHELSYFAETALLPGTIVPITLRGKKRHGLVLSSREATHERSSIKNASFTLRKIPKFETSFALRPEFIAAAKEIADGSFATIGSVLESALHDSLIDEPLKESIVYTERKTAPRYAMQATFEDRVSGYRRYVREAFAEKESVFIMAPTIAIAKRMKTVLERGIESHTVLLAGTDKEISAGLKKVSENSYSLIIATPSFLAIPKDIGHIIIEDEASRYYRSDRRPYVDMRELATIYAKNINATIIYGATCLRTETQAELQFGLISELQPFRRKLFPVPESKLIDMTKYKTSGGGFKIIGDEVKELIDKARAAGEEVVLVTSRRGLAGVTLCGDCGTRIQCPTCDHSMTLHEGKTEETNYFLCHRCGTRDSADLVCKACGSWKLVALGIAVDLVAEKIKSMYGEENIFVMSEDNASTKKKASDLIKNFQKSTGGILITTEMGLHLLENPVAHVAVISVDSMLAIPDFTIEERLFQLLLAARELARDSLYIQTRAAEEPIFDLALRGALDEFAKKSLETRKLLKLPPYETLFRISIAGQKEKIAPVMQHITTVLKNFDIDIFPAYAKRKNGHELNAIFRIPPKASLTETKAALPLHLPYVTVKRNPERFVD